MALFTFAAACAARLPHYTFILRMFPGISLPITEAAVKRFTAAHPNVVASDKAEIADDYARASLLLYRGSSTVLYATLAGLRPVYVQVETLVDTDPLYPLTTWRRACTSPEQFAAIVEADERMPAPQREAEWRTAATYLSRYGGPVGEDALETFLKSIHLGDSTTIPRVGTPQREVAHV